MTAADYEAAGLYNPSSPRAAERLELLEWLSGQGVSLDHMRAAAASGRLPFAASSVAMRPGPFLTREQLAARLKVEPELLEEFRVAFALPPVPEGAPWCNEAEAEMFEAVASGVGLFGNTGMLRLSRVIGSSVSRIAEAMASIHSETLRDLARSGAREIEVAQASLAGVENSGGPARIATGLLTLHLQLSAVRLERTRDADDRDTVHGCVGFVDLAGSTSISRSLSTRQLADMVDRFEDVAHEIAINRRGRVVKFIGDEVMFVTTSADAACDIAVSLVEAFAGDATLTPRGGLAEGALLDRWGDYYGPVVNLAARLGELAIPGEVLVTKEVADHLTRPGLHCESAGRRRLRGFDEPVALMSVSRAPGISSSES